MYIKVKLTKNILDKPMEQWGVDAMEYLNKLKR
jgi:hypothetical protein